jgi:hypothetical protein
LQLFFKSLAALEVVVVLEVVEFDVVELLDLCLVGKCQRRVLDDEFAREVEVGLDERLQSVVLKRRV